MTELPGVRSGWSPGEVLDAHTQLAEKFAHPNASLLDYIDYFMLDATRKNGERAAGMFYPADPRKKLGDGIQAAIFTAFISGGLARAQTYEVTAEMCSVMQQVKAKVDHLEEVELPSPAGFAWLDQPWIIRDLHGEAIPVRLMTWDTTRAWTRGSEVDKLPKPAELPAVRITLWTYVDDDIALRTGVAGPYSGHLDQAEHVMEHLGPLSIVHTALLPYGLRFHRPDDAPDSNPDADSIVDMVHILWMFLGMDIISSDPVQVSRPARRRAQRSLKHQEVRVVVLRRLRHPDTGETVTHHEIEWSCRWIVQGHYRHIEEYEPELDAEGNPRRHHAVVDLAKDKCVICGARVTWVHPYIKGPDGKPLHAAGKTLYKLAR